LAKLQKRLISQISPRNVSFDPDEIASAMAKMGSKAQFVKSYDATDLLLRVAAGEQLSGLDALLMAKTGGEIRKGIFLGEQDAMGIIARASGIETATGLVNDPDVTNILSQQLKMARQQVMAAGVDAEGNPKKKMLKVLEELSDQFKNSTNPAETKYFELIGRMKGK
jgi:hypothetical protein